jgi:hypothetical protein
LTNLGQRDEPFRGYGNNFGDPKFEKRYSAIYLRSVRKIDAVCVGKSFHIADNNIIDGGIDRPITRDDIYELIIDEMPIAKDNVPWEDILSFRAEETSKQQLRMLRGWISDTAKGKLTYAEALEKIEYLIDQYRAHMKSAGLGFWTSTIRTLIVGAAELAENALKFRLKSLAETPFKLIDARIKLIEAERKAVGRELQYIVHVTNSFAR